MRSERANWNEVRSALHQARDFLVPRPETASSGPVPVGMLTGTLDEFNEFIEHNELELAWDALSALGERSNPPGLFWQQLARAAGLMGLLDKQKVALKAARGVRG